MPGGGFEPEGVHTASTASSYSPSMILETSQYEVAKPYWFSLAAKSIAWFVLFCAWVQPAVPALRYSKKTPSRRSSEAHGSLGDCGFCTTTCTWLGYAGGASPAGGAASPAETLFTTKCWYCASSPDSATCEHGRRKPSGISISAIAIRLSGIVPSSMNRSASHVDRSTTFKSSYSYAAGPLRTTSVAAEDSPA